MFENLNLDKTFQFLLIILAFLMPLTVFGGNLIIVIICVLWLFSGNYKSKFDQIINNKLMLASIVFFCIHLVGLLWTEDLAWGLHIVHKMWYFIGLFPILYTIVRKDYISHYISAFLLAISITEVCSYLVWFEVIEPFKNATISNPTPFMSHISYNPILAFAIYFVLHEIFFNKKITNLVFALYSFFAISMTINMFITGGRAGQVMFFAMIAIIIFQFFNTQKIKALFLISFLIPGIFFTAYTTSDLFQERVDAAVKNSLFYSENKASSVGLRITFALNSWEAIKKNPIIGVGTGDFPIEYKKINKINTPGLPNTTNPHNMYVLVAMELGALGVISMLSIFYYQIKLSFNSSNKFIRDFGITLPLLFLVIMCSDSYLLGHYTTLIFVFFSSFLYKDFEKF
ncbi:MAG: O-antigen ligase family protein [Candidatus Marinimicrobia bacterium]|nr:O-antigen ligase family protein [Candidatus Neomarinimicrobiota bacterium]